MGLLGVEASHGGVSALGRPSGGRGSGNKSAKLKSTRTAGRDSAVVATGRASRLSESTVSATSISGVMGSGSGLVNGTKGTSSKCAGTGGQGSRGSRIRGEHNGSGNSDRQSFAGNFMDDDCSACLVLPLNRLFAPLLDNRFFVPLSRESLISVSSSDTLFLSFRLTFFPRFRLLTRPPFLTHSFDIFARPTEEMT
ncbi:unnamed protein product [Protopolystoma xenopodis]|uniref:Uncharacterized protein n=1 Tax=Protopolystoma xenopodis TaxID=117903 RepID=A0A3S5C107_9PLAT|nr:unnamed protein product [Protopolystoma xenopodis]